MGTQFGEIQNSLQSTGSLEFLLPFAILFALVLGILRKTGIIEDDPAQVLLSAGIAGFIAFQTDAPTTIGSFMSETMPVLGMALVGLLGVIIMIGLVGGDDLLSLGGGGTDWVVYGLLGIVALLAWSIYSDTTVVEDMPFIGSISGEGSVSGGMIAVLLILGLIGWAIKGED
jgi:hypothetical protein